MGQRESIYVSIGVGRHSSEGVEIIKYLLKSVFNGK